MQGADDQTAKIAEEKSALRKQLIALVILSFVVSGLFYGITLAQNPYNKWGPQGRMSFSQEIFSLSQAPQQLAHETGNDRGQYLNSVNNPLELKTTIRVKLSLVLLSTSILSPFTLPSSLPFLAL